MEFKKYKGVTIKAAREALGLSQVELAKKLGCRQQTVSEWETGRYTPRNAYQHVLNSFFGGQTIGKK